MLEVIIGSVIAVIVLSFVPKIYYVQYITRLFMYISSAALILMSGLVFYEVVARKLFSGGSIAIQELQWHLYDLVFLFSIAYTLMHDAHVRVDIFYNRFSSKTKAIIKLISILFFIVPLSSVLVYTGISFAYESFVNHEISPDPGGLCCRWIIKSSIAVAFLVVLLQSAEELKKVKDLLKAK